jgi:hypothetical protein
MFMIITMIMIKFKIRITVITVLKEKPKKVALNYNPFAWGRPRIALCEDSEI